MPGRDLHRLQAPGSRPACPLLPLTHSWLMTTTSHLNKLGVSWQPGANRFRVPTPPSQLYGRKRVSPERHGLKTPTPGDPGPPRWPRSVSGWEAPALVSGRLRAAMKWKPGAGVGGPSDAVPCLSQVSAPPSPERELWRWPCRGPSRLHDPMAAWSRAQCLSVPASVRAPASLRLVRAHACSRAGRDHRGLTSWMMLETLSQLAGLMFSPPSTRPS